MTNSIMFNGYRVVESAAMPEFRPRMQLSGKCATILTPEFTAEINAWMIEFFGQTRTMVVVHDAIYGHPKTVAALHMQASRKSSES